MSTPESILEVLLIPLPSLKTLQTSIGRKVVASAQRILSTIGTRPLRDSALEIKNLYDAVWTPSEKYADAHNDSQVVTTQQICDGMIDANGKFVTALVFSTVAKYTPHILVLLPNSIPEGIPANKIITIREDGGVTVSDKPVV